MRSRVTQTVLGIFAGIFTYCLIVLRTIRGGDEGVFVLCLILAIHNGVNIGNPKQYSNSNEVVQGCGRR